MKNIANKYDTEQLTPEYLDERTAWLSEFMTPERATRLEQVLDQRTRYMTVCLENIYHPQNASALVRHCDAFGIQDIYTVEDVCRFRPSVNVVKGTDKWVTLRRHFRTGDCVGALRDKGYRIIATTPHEGDCPPEEFDIAAGPFALVFGTEHEGVSREVKDVADGFIRVPMWGFVDSLNVSACASIILYMLSKKLRDSDLSWKLTEDEKRVLLFDWMRRSVRDAETILAKFPVK